MGEVSNESPDSAPRPGVEVFEPPEDEESNILYFAGLFLGAGALGVVLLLQWDRWVDGNYSRRRGGLEKLMDSMGQTPTVAFLFGLSLLGLVLTVWTYRKEAAEWDAEQSKEED